MWVRCLGTCSISCSSPQWSTCTRYRCLFSCGENSPFSKWMPPIRETMHSSALFRRPTAHRQTYPWGCWWMSQWFTWVNYTINLSYRIRKDIDCRRNWEPSNWRIQSISPSWSWWRRWITSSERSGTSSRRWWTLYGEETAKKDNYRIRRRMPQQRAWPPKRTVGASRLRGRGRVRKEPLKEFKRVSLRRRFKHK